jgi:hypothetical protein
MNNPFLLFENQFILESDHLYSVELQKEFTFSIVFCGSLAEMYATVEFNAKPF